VLKRSKLQYQGERPRLLAAFRRPATLGNHTLVLFAEAELVDLLF
jgi:hypothetical protein